MEQNNKAALQAASPYNAAITREQFLFYNLVIADESGLQMPQKEEFQIDIAFVVDEFDFFS